MLKLKLLSLLARLIKSRKLAITNLSKFDNTRAKMMYEREIGYLQALIDIKEYLENE